MTKKFTIKNRIKSFAFAFNGIKMLVITQHNFWIHLFVAIVVVCAGFVLKISQTEWSIIVLCIGFVLTAEAFNTSIEFLTDLLEPQQNPKAGVIKDIAAGAVLISAIVAIINGIIIFAPKLISSFNKYY